jgi:hypothetical protein
MTSSSPLPTGEAATVAQPINGECPKSEPIKGNIGKRGKVYHVPDSKGYAKVKPEACFTTTAAAEQAGFRAAKARSENSKPTP